MDDVTKASQWPMYQYIVNKVEILMKGNIPRLLYTAMMESKILTWLYPVHLDHERPGCKSGIE